MTLICFSWPPPTNDAVRRAASTLSDVHEVTREDPDPDEFFASVPNLGLLGVVSKIVFECVDSFDIAGQEATTSVEECSVDLFGEGGGGPGRDGEEGGEDEGGEAGPHLGLVLSGWCRVRPCHRGVGGFVTVTRWTSPSS